VNLVAGPIQSSSSPMPNQSPSTNFSGCDQTPPISPPMCQPWA
jgi:hypothetical protein